MTMQKMEEAHPELKEWRRILNSKTATPQERAAAKRKITALYKKHRQP